MSEDNNNQPRTLWKDCKAIYPPKEEIASALQDRGNVQSTRSKGKEIKKHKFPLIEKLAAKIYTAIQREFKNPKCLTQNVSRGKLPLAKVIVVHRSLKDITETHPFFHP